MTEIALDLNGNFEVSETGGVVLELRRGFIAQGFNEPDEFGDIVTDPEVIWTLLEDIGLPSAGDVFLFGTLETVLVDRDITGQSHSTVSGVLVYQRHAGWFKGSAGLAQIQTPFERDGVTQLSLIHPDGVTKIPALLSVRSPRQTLRKDYQKQLQGSPRQYTDQFLGRVNELLWAGGAPGTWLVTGLDYERMAPGKPSGAWYHFSAEFEYNPENHQPDIWLEDTETGKPAVGLSEGESFKTIPWYATADLLAEFGEP
tara:strand:+ start:1221 stop:1991 length:771 start_codon:yes stop_codon:yes gene_type:complete